MVCFLLPTICPAPTTPNRLTSAAAARLELVLKEGRLALLARLVNCRPAKSDVDISDFKCLSYAHISEAVGFLCVSEEEESMSEMACSGAGIFLPRQTRPQNRALTIVAVPM